jgi:hypothetical protein
MNLCPACSEVNNFHPKSMPFGTCMVTTSLRIEFCKWLVIPRRKAIDLVELWEPQCADIVTVTARTGVGCNVRASDGCNPSLFGCTLTGEACLHKLQALWLMRSGSV